MIKQFNGHSPEIHPSSYVSEEAVVIGKVFIGKNVSIWPGAVLRGDVEDIIIKDDTNIQDGVLIHTNYGIPTIIGCGVSVGHGAVLHGTAIGDNCLIGMKAVLLDGSEIGANSVVGAGAVVTEKTRILSGKLVLGVPAKVIRDLTPEEIAYIKANAVDYIKFLQIYKKNS